MKKGKIIAIIAVIVLLLLGGSGYYFGFVNDETYVKIRMYLAENYMEKEQYDKAEAMYQKVIERDEMQEDAYLGLGQISMHRERYASAIDVLKHAIDVTGHKKPFQEELTTAVLARAEELLGKDTPSDAIELLLKFGNDYIGFDEIKTVLGRAYLARAEQIRDVADLKQSLTFLSSADPEKADYEVFRQYRVDGYLTLGNEAFENDDFAGARQYYNMVLLLDPVNDDARSMLELLAAEEDKVRSFTVIGKGTMTLNAMVYGGFNVSLPVDIHLVITYNGEDADKALMYYNINAEASLLGQKQEIFKECYYSEENGLRYERSANGPWSYYEENGDFGAVAEDGFASYNEIAQQGTADANTVELYGQTCKVVRDHKTGNDYLALFSGDDSGELKATLGGLDLNEVRYIAMENDQVVHVEADLSGSDFSGVLSKIEDAVDSIDAEFSVSEFRMTFDLTGFNSTSVLMPDMSGNAFPGN